jgi:hypothetical protein
MLVALHGGDGWRRHARRLAPLALLVLPALVYLVLRTNAGIPLFGVSATQSLPSGLQASTGGVERVLVSASQLSTFLRMLVWPHPLRASYDDYAPSTGVFGLVLHLVIVGMALLWWRRAPLVAVAVAFFYVALLPVTRIVSHLGVVSTVAERFVYLPSAGATIALAFGVDVLWRRFGRNTAIAAVVPVVLILAGLTLARNSDWSSNRNLWEAEVEAAPSNPDGWRWLTAVYLNHREYGRLAALCDEQLTRHPDYAALHGHCAQGYEAANRVADAERAFRRATELGGGSNTHLATARFYLKHGRTAEAQRHYETAIELQGDEVRRHTLRGEMLRRTYEGRLDDAEAEYLAALAIEPRYAAARKGLAFTRSLQKSRR